MGTGPSDAAEGDGATVAGPSAAAAAATTWGEQRWLASRWTTSRPGHTVGQRGEEARVGAVPGVDRLVRVAHRAEVVPVRHEGLDQAVLRRVHVLELVDGHVAVAPAGELGEAGSSRRRSAATQEHVVEVEETTACEPVLVGGVELGHPSGRRPSPAAPGSRRVPVGIEAPGLGPADLGVGGRGQGPVAGEVDQLAEAVSDQHGGGAARVGRPPAQQREGELVEGPGPDARRGRPTGGAGGGDRDAVADQAVAQLAGGLAGEGAHDRVVGVGRAVEDPPGHPQGEHAGLARSGAGHDAEGVGRGRDGVALCRGELGAGPVEAVVGARTGRLCGGFHGGRGYRWGVPPGGGGRPR